MLSPNRLLAEDADATQPIAGETRSLGDVLIRHRRYAAHAAVTGGADPPVSDASAVTLVLVHGWSCDATYWDAQLPALRAKYPVFTVDLAGHGTSTGAREDMSITAFGTDVARAVTEALPAGQLVLIGHSMGGPVAIEAALQLGTRVSAVIGVDTFKNIGAPPADPAQTEARLQFFAQDFVGTTTAFVTQTFFREDADPDLKARIAAAMAAANPAVGIAAIRGLNDWDGVQALSQLSQRHADRLPVLAINARHGSPTDLLRLKSVYRNFRLQEMAGVGHFLMMEQPERFNAVLMDALADLIDPTSQTDAVDGYR